MSREMNEVKLGEIITSDTVYRDAVHIAVAPVIAGERLKPGEHIGLLNGVAYSVLDTIGIVDPFLTEDIQIGQKFYIFLYQNTVMGMRHVWSHPAFKAKPLPEITEDSVASNLLVQMKQEGNLPSFERVMKDG